MDFHRRKCCGKYGNIILSEKWMALSKVMTSRLAPRHCFFHYYSHQIIKRIDSKLLDSKLLPNLDIFHEQMWSDTSLEKDFSLGMFQKLFIKFYKYTFFNSYGNRKISSDGEVRLVLLSLWKNHSLIIFSRSCNLIS